VPTNNVPRWWAQPTLTSLKLKNKVNRSVAIFGATRNGVYPISGANNGAPAIAFGGSRSSWRALRAAPGLPQ